MSITSLAANFGWCLQQFDVKNAFLHGELEERSLWNLHRAVRRTVGSIRFFKLKKGKQSSSAWPRRFTKAMLSRGNHTFFIKHSDKGTVAVLPVYVGDIIIMRNDVVEKESLRKNLPRVSKSKIFAS